jgi:hypothetical protein
MNFEQSDIKPYRFVRNWEIPPLDKMMDTTEGKMLIKANRGTLTREDKDWIAEALHDHARHTSIQLAGWCFDYRYFMRRFYVKTQWYGVQEVYAFNKTQIRKILCKFMGKIYDICETENEEKR